MPVPVSLSLAARDLDILPGELDLVAGGGILSAFDSRPGSGRFAAHLGFSTHRARRRVSTAGTDVEQPRFSPDRPRAIRRLPRRPRLPIQVSIGSLLPDPRLAHRAKLEQRVASRTTGTRHHESDGSDPHQQRDDDPTGHGSKPARSAATRAARSPAATKSSSRLGLCPVDLVGAGERLPHVGPHRGVVARIVTDPHDANRQNPCLPMRYDAGRPRAVIRFKISQPRTTSLPCPAGLRARRPSPMMDV